MAKTSDALKIIDSLTGDDFEMENLIREASLNAIVAQLIYEARTARGLTQKQLADRVGTKQSAIARLEDADYDGHSLSIWFIRLLANLEFRPLSIQYLVMDRR